VRWDRAVVLCHTGAGLRAGAWLAEQGVAVRLLCTGPFPVHGAQQVVRGPWSVVGPLCAERRQVEVRKGIWLRGRWWASPRRKRDLLRAAGAEGVGGLLGALADRLGRTDDAESWVRMRLGSTAWEGGLGASLGQRLGGSLRGVPAGVAGAVFGRGEREPAWAVGRDGASHVEHLVDAVIEGGGEALEEVGVEGLEVEHGRVVAVHTEFGRELVPGPLFTDLAPWQLAPWLEGELAAPPQGPGALSVEVELPAAAALPYDVGWVLGERPPLVAVRAALDPSGCVRSDAVVAELRLPPFHPARRLDDRALASLARTLLDGMVELAPGPARVSRGPGPVVDGPSAAAWRGLAEAYQRLGVVPLGPTGWQLPHRWADELASLALAADGAVTTTLRDALLRPGPPEEPWSLVSEA